MLYGSRESTDSKMDSDDRLLKSLAEIVDLIRAISFCPAFQKRRKKRTVPRGTPDYPEINSCPKGSPETPTRKYLWLDDPSSRAQISERPEVGIPFPSGIGKSQDGSVFPANNLRN